MKPKLRNIFTQFPKDAWKPELAHRFTHPRDFSQLTHVYRPPSATSTRRAVTVSHVEPIISDSEHTHLCPSPHILYNIYIIRLILISRMQI
jgi:hypothetical protein